MFDWIFAVINGFELGFTEWNRVFIGFHWVLLLRLGYLLEESNEPGELGE